VCSIFVASDNRSSFNCSRRTVVPLSSSFVPHRRSAEHLCTVYISKHCHIDSPVATGEIQCTPSQRVRRSRPRRFASHEHELCTIYRTSCHSSHWWTDLVANGGGIPVFVQGTISLRLRGPQRPWIRRDEMHAAYDIGLRAHPFKSIRVFMFDPWWRDVPLYFFIAHGSQSSVLLDLMQENVESSTQTWSMHKLPTVHKTYPSIPV
jgi:hypothetical protein